MRDLNLRQAVSKTLLLVAFLVLATNVAAAFAVEMPTYGKRFCEGGKVHDYERVLDRLPPVRHVPESRDLPFGPRNMSIYSTAPSRVIVGRGGFGYSFFDDTFGVRSEVRLFWDVTTRLSRIDRGGRVQREVDSETRYLGVLKDVGDPSFWLDTPAQPALYRYDIEFRDHRSGDPLGSYSEYLRVVKPTHHAGIAVSPARVRPGQEVFARVENRGTGWIGFGLPYAVQRLEEGGWVEQPLGVDGWLLPLILMEGGHTGWCMRYDVPTDASPGWYRFVKDLSFFGRERDKQAVAAFPVNP